MWNARRLHLTIDFGLFNIDIDAYITTRIDGNFVYAVFHYTLHYQHLSTVLMPRAFSRVADILHRELHLTIAVRPAQGVRRIQVLSRVLISQEPPPMYA